MKPPREWPDHPALTRIQRNELEQNRQHKHLWTREGIIFYSNPPIFSLHCSCGSTAAEFDGKVVPRYADGGIVKSERTYLVGE